MMESMDTSDQELREQVYHCSPFCPLNIGQHGQQLDRDVNVYTDESCHYDEDELVCVY